MPDAEKFVVIDVGCRAGPTPSGIVNLPNVRVIGFDVDGQACTDCKNHWPQFDFLPFGLGSQPGRGTLYMTEFSDCNSFLPPLAEAKITDPAFTEIGQLNEVEIRTLDSFQDQYFPEGADFLKIDTQGTELEVLRGSEETLKSLLMVQCEVEFNPFYKGQALFGDVDSFLRSRAFEFWDFQCEVRYRDGGHHPWGQLNWADAFWISRPVKNPEKLKAIARAVGFAHYEERPPQQE